MIAKVIAEMEEEKTEDTKNSNEEGEKCSIQ